MITTDKAVELLSKLGATSYTVRHVNCIKELTANDSIDPKLLLDSLGNWDETDLSITQDWINTLKTN